MRIEIKALKKLSLEIDSGIFGLLGPNGAGKTTIMRILATLLPPSDGEVRIGDYHLGKDNQEIRSRLGYLPQEFGLDPRFKARELLDYIAILKGISDSRDRARRVDEMLEKVNLTSTANKRLGTFSGGMKQRMGIAQALLGDPELLIIDEPTAGLDPEERIRFRNILTDLAQDRVVLLSTHIVADIEATCCQLAVLDDGELRFKGSPAELVARAKGKVWEVTVGDREAESFRTDVHRRGLKVISSRRTEQGMVFRLVGEDAASLDAQQVTPGSEDAYVYLMNGGVV